jgi:hypothetical protein
MEITLMKCLALVKRPSVVCRADSGPNGTRSLSFSKQVRNWARLSIEKKNRINSMNYEPEELEMARG